MEARRAIWQDAAFTGVTLDMQAEQGVLLVRRLDARMGGVRLSAAGSVAEAGRLDAKMDLTVADAGTLRPLLARALPPGWQAGPGLLRGQASARATLAGPPDALALNATAELGDLLVEAQPVLDLAAQRWVGPVTLRHPGAPRLLEGLGFPATASWLGDGSFSLLAQLDLRPGRVAAEHFSMSAGALRASGQLALDRQGVPALTGGIAAETLPLPLPYAHAPDPLPVGILGGWRAAVSLQAVRVLAGLTPVLESASASLALDAGVLRLDRVAGTVGGGALAGAVLFDTAGELPRLAADGALGGVLIGGPLFDLPLDISAGRADGRFELSASGYSPAALLASLSGNASAVVRDAVVSGFDLAEAGAALADAIAAGPGAAAAARLDRALRAAVNGGTTPAERLDLKMRADRGIVQVDGSGLAGPTGTTALGGNVDFPARTVDLRVSLRPAVAGLEGEPPEIGLRLTGPPAAPRRTPELAGALRWLAERPVRTAPSP